MHRGLRAAEQALQRDSAIADAWMARGFLYAFEYPRTFAGAREAFERALALDPDNAEALHSYADVLLTLRDDSAAAAAYHRALAIEPTRSTTLDHLAILSYVQRRYYDARRWLDSAHAVDPGFVDAYGLGILLHMTTGEVEEARRDAAARFRSPPSPSSPPWMLWRATLSRRGTAWTASSKAMENPAAPSPPEGFLVGWALVVMSDTGRAFDVLERVRPRGAVLSFYLGFPEFDPLRATPRFQRMVEDARPK